MKASVYPRRDGRLLVVLEGTDAAFQWIASREEAAEVVRVLIGALVLEVSDRGPKCCS